MAARHQLHALRNHPNLQRFLVSNARPTGKQLGNGSYGSVEELEVNGVVCAGKKIHETLIEQGNDGAENIASKYVEECKLMSDLRHPHLVQFLGICFLPNVALPVLVMERLLMNLDDLLDPKHNPDLPLCLKRSILADIAKGLVYLHNRRPPVIHRDLSAKNVLLNSAMVAKISDLGNSRIVDFQRGKLAQTLSRVPGTMVYMPPEAFDSTSRYGCTLDSFSFGHLALFTVTQVFPGDLLPNKYRDPNSRIRKRLLARSEVERRDEYFQILHKQLEERHPLVQLIERCLDDEPSERPSAEELLRQLEDMCAQIKDPYEHLTKLDAIKEKESKQRMSAELRELQIDNSTLQMTVKNQEAKIRKLVSSPGEEANEQMSADLEFINEEIRKLHIQLKGKKEVMSQERRHLDIADSFPTEAVLPITVQKSSSYKAMMQQGKTSTTLAKQQGSPQPFPGLGTGSTVQVSDPPRYGVIRWIGMLQSFQGAIAGIELEEYMEGCGDGVWDGTRHFTCAPGKGFFCLLANVKPDHRFTEGVSATTVGLKNPLDHVPLEEPRDQYISGTQLQKYLGEGRGIQGHQNSCYLDATVFGLFALSDVFDPMFLMEAKNPAGEVISNMLWKGIVNPLRRNGVVRHESVMALRNKLEELGKMKGVNQDVKDPEEFLNMLFKHTLNVEPFISIKRPFGTEQEYFVQLFLEPELKQPPTVAGLLSKMFKEQNILFTQIPSKLLIRVPRFGRQFKTYEKVIPALYLDVIDLVDTLEIHENVGAITELDLLSVICIETSHYVCFTRSAAQDRWIFFDSMANRVYDKYNIPKGVDCTQDLNEWVYTKDHTMLMKTPSRDLPEFVRRFTQDIYLCVYTQPDVDMYGP